MLANLISGPGGAGTLLGHSHAETLQTPIGMFRGHMERSWLTLVTQSSSHVGLQNKTVQIKAKGDTCNVTVRRQIQI